MCSYFWLVGDSLAILRAELKSQRKHVRNLKKKSLWSKILEEVATHSFFNSFLEFSKLDESTASAHFLML